MTEGKGRDAYFVEQVGSIDRLCEYLEMVRVEVDQADQFELICS